MTKTLLLSMLAALSLAVSGCNNCEKLTESICSDLGATDCAVWKEIGGPDQAVPGGRGVNRACGSIRDNEAAYQGTLNGARGLVLAERLQRAVAKGDKAEQEKVKQELDANSKRIMEGVAKVREAAGN